MNFRLMSLLRKEFSQILHDKRSLVIPIMQLLLLRVSAPTDVR